ncbi:MAG: heat-inducible transcriptional repressor HrcA [Chloroflexota bacterium]|nr:heat-inducible transcriptional repressor HrcA [Chloroflexota bacterium]
MLIGRRANILRCLVQEYISTATPVSSQSLARNYGLGVSSATIRNELALLEEEDFIVQPHTSAGRIPTAKGYRYYVEVLLEERELTGDEQRLIRHQFYQVSKGIEDWIHLSAAILSRLLHNVAIVTLPQQPEPRLKIVNLISLRELSALLIVVFQNASYRQRPFDLDEMLSQEELSAVAARFTQIYEGLPSSSIRERKDTQSPTETKVKQVLLDVMDEEEEHTLGDLHYDGLSQILNQPEFAKSDRAKVLMELLEERNLLNSVLLQAPEDERLRVVIGNENPQSSMHDFSLVLSRYGQPEEASGIVGIVGPTRMAYGKTLSAVRFLSNTMSELLCELYK